MELFARTISPENSYQLHLNENDKLEWRTTKAQRDIIIHHEPANIFRRLQVILMDVLPIKSQL